MKAVAPRIERLYESEAQRWRAAWEPFFDRLWRSMRDDELEAYNDYTETDEATRKRIAVIMEAWNKETGWIEDKAYGAFFKRADEVLPHDLDWPDLSRWPEAMPQPPSRADQEERLWAVSRRDLERGGDERLAAGCVAFHLAVVSVARLYSREKR